MRPLCVRAVLAGPVALPGGSLALDGLLAAKVAEETGLPPPSVHGVQQVEVPLAKAPGGRFHLASFASFRWEVHEARWVNRRFPVPEAQALAGPKLRRITLSSGPCKSYRLPLEVGHVEADTLTWWCTGDAGEVQRLLALVTHLGKRRAVGHGRVREWLVEECQPWGEGFPVVRDGHPMRPLPPDWPGLSAQVELAYATLSFPYWLRHREEVCAVPRWGEG